jgi:hypothetical protein|tara:strand:+ start:831 stop:1091 length:261 start_codon:yes stop_codon:yes gene_type:complete
MAEKLEQMPSWAHRGRREYYPYDTWFDGTPWLLTRGVDFVQERRGMVARIRMAATRRNFKVWIGQRANPETGTDEISVQKTGSLKK